MTDTRYDRIVRRAALPEVLLPADVGLALGIPEEDAERAVEMGRLGPSFLVGGRPALLRGALLNHLAKLSGTTDREVAPGLGSEGGGDS